MQGNRAAIAAVLAIVLLAGGWWLYKRGTGPDAVDLIAQLDGATKRPADRTFTVEDVTLNGETHRAINAMPPARITWRVTVPEDAWLRVRVGMKPESWTAEGNGALFFVVVSDDRTSETLFEQFINPFRNEGDRKWVPVMVDLSQYAGEEINIIFNTWTGRKGEADDPRNDLAVWGAPEIITR